MRKPTTNKLTFPYNSSKPPYSATNRHQGSDYSISPDPYWYAPEPIRVTLVTEGKMCGKQIDFQSVTGSRKYRACHNSIIYAKRGRGYQEGFKMAKMGSTGFAQGAHLHLVMWVNGKRVDPDKTLNKLVGDKDMYQGRTAKYYHDKLVRTQKELDKYKGYTKTHRLRLNSVLDKLKSIVKGK